MLYKSKRYFLIEIDLLIGMLVEGSTYVTFIAFYFFFRFLAIYIF